MTPFREWPEGQPFQTIDAGYTRFGVKLPVVSWISRDENGIETKETGNALFLDTMGIETVHHHKNVEAIANFSGHLARDVNGKSCLVRRMGNGEQYVGYYVLPTQYKNFLKPDFALIKPQDGESEENVKNVIQTIETFETQRQKAFEYLKLILKYNL